jgi:hypothetical protein
MLASACLLVFTFLATAPSLQAQTTNGIWTNLLSGSWTNAANWSNSVTPGGVSSTADFSTLSFTTPAITNTLGAAWTVGNLIFANDTPSVPATNTNWVVNASSTNATLPATNVLIPESGASRLW